MMPTSTQMLAAMQLAISEHVAPNVTDQWAQSALRSIDAILNHLQARVPVEGPMLHADTQELEDVLASASLALGHSDPSVVAFLAEAPEILAGYAAVEALQALNHRGREALEGLLLHCRSHKGDPAADTVHAELRAYLLRHADRESAFFFPVYVGRPV